MSSPQPSQSPYKQPLGCQFLIYLSVIGFFILMAIVLIPSLRDGIASAVHCPSAIETISEERDTGSQRLRAGSAARTGTSTTTLTCNFADDSVKVVGNDTIFLTAVGAGIAASLALTIVAMPLMKLSGWLRTRDRQAS